MHKMAGPLEHQEIMNPRSTICFVAGRSGGHLIPCITLAEQYKNEEAERNLVLFSTSTSLDEHIVTSNTTFSAWVPLPLDNVPNKLLHYPLFILQLGISFIKSFYYLIKYRPARVVSLGGYISIPVCLTAWVLRIPVELFEVNVLPGKAINFLAPYATTISVCFEETKKYFPKKKICTLADYPIRFSNAEGLMPHNMALAALGLDAHKKTIVILGGSQGSRFINTIVQKWVIEHPHLHDKVQIVHQTGAADFKELQAWYKTHHISALVFDFLQDLATTYGAADVIICRSGAGTLFEIGFFNKECITIPLETPQTDHQLYNGLALAKLWPDLVTVLQQGDIEQQPKLLFNEINRHVNR